METFLVLHHTDTATFDCEVPEIIELKQIKTVIGRGSPLFPVDVKICARINDKEVISRNHANIVFDATSKHFVINDMGAMNGLFVNNIRIRSHKLVHNDVIQFGGLYNAVNGSVLNKTDINIKYKFVQNKIASKKRALTATSPILDSSVASSNTPAPKVSRKELQSTPVTKSTPATPSTTRKVLERAVVSKITVASTSGSTQAIISDMLSVVGGKTSPATAAAVAQQSGPPPGIVNDAKAVVSHSLTPVTPTSSNFCSVDISSLRANLCCTLCGDILVDAVVLKCSHGYCRHCLETHIRGFKSTCPVCNDPPVQRNSLSSKTGFSRMYSRCDHLDSLVWLLLEASDTTVNEEFKQREKAGRDALRRLGVDPDMPHNSVDSEDVSEAKSEKEGHLRDKDTPSKGRSDTRDKSAPHLGSTPSYLSRFNATGRATPSQLSRSTLSSTPSSRNDSEHQNQKPAKVMCDYCGGFTHSTKKCPHREEEEENSDEDESDSY